MMRQSVGPIYLQHSRQSAPSVLLSPTLEVIEHACCGVNVAPRAKTLDPRMHLFAACLMPRFPKSAFNQVAAGANIVLGQSASGFYSPL